MTCDLPACVLHRTQRDLGVCLAQYQYLNANGTPSGQVHRYEPRSFRPFMFKNGEWTLGGSIGLLYRLPDLTARAWKGRLVFVEGERDVDTIYESGPPDWAATTNPYGASGWSVELLEDIPDDLRKGSPLIIGDADDAGRRWVQAVAQSLRERFGLEAEILWTTRGKDLTDHLRNGGTFTELTAIYDQSFGAHAPVIDVLPPLLRTPLTRSALNRLTPPAYLIGELITTPGVAVLIGDYSVGKTALAMAMACCVATGSPLLTHAVQQRKTLYITGEGKSGIGARIHAWETHFSRQVGDDQWLMMPGLNGSLIHKSIWQQLEELCSKLDIGFVIFDTLSSLAPDADETADAAAIMAGLNGLSQTINGTVLLVHHTGWSDKKRARGGSQIHANADTVLILTADNAKGPDLTLTVHKAKDRPSGAKFRLSRLVIGTAGSITIDAADSRVTGDLLRDQIEAFLKDAGPEGATKRELTDHTGMNPNSGTLNRILQTQIEKRIVLKVGSSTKTRYVYALACSD